MSEFIELIAKIKPANGQTFALMDAIEIEMPDGTRLDGFFNLTKDLVGMPTITTEDNLKILQAEDGKWKVVTIADSAIKAFVEQSIVDSKLPARVYDLEIETALLSAICTELGERVDLVEFDLSALATLVSERLTTVGQQLSDITDNVSKIEQDVASLGTNLSYLEDTTAKVSESMTAIEGVVAEVEKLVDEAVGTVAGMEQAVVGLETSVDLLDQDVVRLDEGLEGVKQQIADMLYKEIALSNVSHNTNVKEMGDTIKSVNITWQLNKTPKSLTIKDNITGDVEELGVNVRNKFIDGLEITMNNRGTVKWTITAIDERDTKSIVQTPDFSFQNGVYWDVSKKPASVDGNFIGTLRNKSITGSKNLTVSVTGGADMYFWYAYPSRLGESIFHIGGLDYTFKGKRMQFINKYEHEEEYIVYVSDNPLLSKVSITVKGV